MVNEIKKKNYALKRTVLLIILILIAAVIITGCMVLSDFTGVSLKETKRIKIPEGYGTSKIAQLLENEDVIKYPLLFKIKARIDGYDTKLRTGEFEIADNMSYKDILETLSTKDIVQSRRVTIPEGFELKQIAARLEENGIVTEEEFYEAVELSYDYEFLAGLPEREQSLEGYLFPDTYDFKPGDSAENVIKTMLDNFDRHFKAEYYDRAGELGMTVDEIITLASIIERETNTDTERKKVAGVFYNRINENMRLQSCATVQYALGERKAVLSIADTKTESPYNTYINNGLPVGPIASPGSNCIEAALYPEETDALYFVLDSDGNHIFSSNYDDHLAAKKNAAVKVEQE